MKNLNFFAARNLARQGRGVRRDGWRKWLLFNSAFVFDECIPGADASQDEIRIAQSVSASGVQAHDFANLAAFPATGQAGVIYRALDTGTLYEWTVNLYALASVPDLAQFTFAREDFLAVDWTDETWPSGPAAPSVPAFEPVSASSGDGEGTGNGTGSTGSTGAGDSTTGDSTGRRTGDEPTWGYATGGSGGGGRGARGQTRPHAPPAGAVPLVIVSYTTDLVPGGPSCLLDSQYGGPDYCTVIMRVQIIGGDPGVFTLHIQLGAETKPAESGHAGYDKQFAFTVAVNAGGTLTPNVIYYPTSGNVTAATPLFTFPSACAGADFLTFDVRFQGTLEFTRTGDGEPPDPEDPGTYPSATLGTHGYTYDITKSYVVSSSDGTMKTATALDGTPDADCDWHAHPDGGVDGTGTNAGIAPATILVNVASTVVSSPQLASPSPPGEYEAAVVALDLVVPWPVVSHTDTPAGGNTQTLVMA